MAVKDGQIVLPDGMSYRLLVLQNCVSPVPEIARRVGGYQGLAVSPMPSKTMSVEVIQKLRKFVLDGATIVGAPPDQAVGLKDYPPADAQTRAGASRFNFGNSSGCRGCGADARQDTTG